MSLTPADSFAKDLADNQLAGDALNNPENVPRLVDLFLNSARQHGTTDIHLIPRAASLEMNWRINGVLHLIAEFPDALKANIVSRLKVLAELLTYHADVPQEGRISRGEQGFEMRVSTFPSVHGEKAVIRLFIGSGDYRTLSSLGYPDETLEELKRNLYETSGVIMLTGPSGSGKTTTAYACLRAIVEDSPIRRAISTLEDPIESIIPAASQSQIRPSRGFDYAVALKSLLRQDPEVILVGEIRDTETAQLVFQAALTGHLVITTFHAGSASEAVSRLLDMGIEPYQLTSGLLCALNQQLARKLCSCAQAGSDETDKLGLDVEKFQIPTGCDNCDGTGYAGRFPIIELLTLDAREIRQSILNRMDSGTIDRAAIQSGMISRWEMARTCVESGQTSPAEIRRILGFRQPKAGS
ncbi:MAG: type II/IV secretion system protein [Planctomycetaceae bacterium]|nr:type II/IV secretion system protein [Planctomycetaceae bacterium]